MTKIERNRTNGFLSLSKQLLLYALCAVLIVFSKVSGNSFFVYGSLAFFLAIVLLSDFQDSLAVLLFFLPFSAIIKTSPGAISLCSVAVALLVVKMFMMTKIRVSAKGILLILMLVVITVFGKVIYDYSFDTSYIMFFVTFFFVAFASWNFADRISFEKMVFAFATGIILATVLSLMFQGNENLNAYIKVLVQENLEIERLCGFYPDPNFYAAQTVTAFGCLLLIAGKSAVGHRITILYAFLTVICGATSLSKSFAIALLVVFTVWLFSLPQMRIGASKKLKILSFVSVVVLIALVSGALDGQIEDFIVRFASAEDAEGLTTGRTELWKEYIAFLTANPAALLVGQGLTPVFNGVEAGSHNTVIQMVYQFGLIGTGVMVAFWGQLSTYVCKRQKTKLFPYLLLGVSCFFMWFGLDELLFDDFFLTMALFIFGKRYLTQQQATV